MTTASQSDQMDEDGTQWYLMSNGRLHDPNMVELGDQDPATNPEHFHWQDVMRFESYSSAS